MIDFEMTNVSRRGAVVSGILILVLALAACTGGEGSGGSEDAGGATEQETTETAASVGHYVLPGEAVYPEGIAYEPSTGDFFVGSTTDGTIFKQNAGLDEGEAEVLLEPGSDGRETAVGIRSTTGADSSSPAGTRAASSSTTSCRVG